MALISMPCGQAEPEMKEGIDPVLQFYVKQADSVFGRTELKENDLRYSFLAFTYFKRIGRKGVVERLDSSVTRYFCSGKSIDSTQVLLEPENSIPQITFGYPNVFTEHYEHNFFPNDIGDTNLAIGFDNFSSTDTLPTGVAVIDRDDYALHRLYLYFPNTKDYKRLTRSFRFAEFSGLVFPDSIWEVGAKQGVFTVEYYRMETEIGQLQFLR